MAGDAETGISIMQMEAGLDTGPVLLQEATPIGADETTGALHDRLAAMGARLILQALAGLPGWCRSRSRPRASPTPPRSTRPRRASTGPVRRGGRAPIRGLSPFPGAWTETPEGRLKLLNAQPVAGQGRPGEVLEGLTVACGDGAVAITEAQREGKRPMSAKELLRGLELPPGTILG
jgi:methionyl-tRNA formyltransferase